ncbi:ATP-dependent Clp protease proteolytic subunit 2 [Phycisphaerae bacterium RAS2]|nr:ATP-dependent Clp protease proteolytic subunit 2 [Phycisphaerae bacterium RAS2]
MTQSQPPEAVTANPQSLPQGHSASLPQRLDVVYVSFCAEVNPTTTEALLKTCSDLANRGVRQIYLLLSTPGGGVSNGITLFNVLRALPCQLVTHNVGSVNSIGNVLFLAGEMRYASPGTTFMFHGVGFDIVDRVRFEERNLVERLQSIRADQKKIADIIRSRTSFPKDGEIKRLFLQAATKDTAFAKERGIIHEIREAKVPDGAPVVQLVFKR